MYDYSQLDALSYVLRTGSFDIASAQLGVTQSAISQRIKLLEERVGAVLVKRGQPCTATPMGARLAAHTDQVRLMEKSIRETVGTAPNATPLRIAANADSLAVWLLPALAAQDGFLYDLIIDDQDHSADWLRAGEVAAAVTGHPGPVQGCDSYALGSLRYYATASPDYIARHMPNGPTAEALSKASALTFNPKDRLQNDWAKAITGRAINLPTHHLATSQGFVAAACLGMGWGMNPEILCREEFASGKLQTLGQNAPLDVPLYWQISRLTAAPLRALTRSVIDAARSVLIQG